MGTLITVADLAGRLDHPDTRVIDCRYSLTDENAGQRAYAASHIPGAIHADLGHDLSAPIVPGVTGRHPLPERATFASFLSRSGINNTCKVVAYDDGPGAFAARCWWMLRWLGHADVQVLDGGFSAWNEAGQVVTDEVSVLPPSTFGIRPGLTRQVSAAEIQSFAGLVLDARDEARYRGEAEPIDPVAGHIPGAICAPFAGNVDDGGQLHSTSQLRRRFAELGVEDQDVVCYCGSGVTATHNILAMVHAGLDEPALYPGSWSEWITDPDRPIAAE